MADPVLYSFRRCPYAIRARLALAVSGTMVEHREVVLRDKPPELLAASPKGTVPVLVLADAAVIDESLDIMRWALARNDPEGWLARHDAALVTTNDGPFKHHLDRYKYAARHDSDPEEHRAAGAQILMELERRLAHQTFLCGDARGFADAAIFPFVRQYALTDREWFEAEDWPHLRSWLDTWLAAPLFTSVMARHQPWQARA